MSDMTTPPRVRLVSGYFELSGALMIAGTVVAIILPALTTGRHTPFFAARALPMMVAVLAIGVAIVLSAWRELE